ncbi:nuclear transport factor 2 family protein [Rahnella perminowiae]|uniref:Nuclear transport factor 2 family protein n=1 Tax=Rahnella perminowiae TaxID=2816244 RepID=A0ABS6L397_9GAMM|nr:MULTISPECIES: nuclear transport factor 2 family protein [Rahnella]MBU9809721.1 nuclear transport factor 2 family protein [Rahnella perminowiae]MBU9825174.1 nuclear transport factor 2 family protein [Rahnella perminowiae]MBU9836330.1 nuclear transport factor 2 family protein [Rahnella perminowiae]UJD92033.1 steroid delta-isomerase [Rahnella aquatilis]
MDVVIPVEKQFQAYNSHDLDTFVSCYSDDFIAYRMPNMSPSLQGKEALRTFYKHHRFNNAALRAELISRTVLGNNVFDHEMIYGIYDTPVNSIAVFEVEKGLIKTAWFYFE